MKRMVCFAILCTLFCTPSALRADDDAPEADGTITFSQGLVTGPAGRYGRSAIHSDPVEHQLVTATWVTPRAGDGIKDTVRKTDLTWTAIDADEKGWFQHKALRGGYLHLSVESAEETVMILHASGHSLVYVNGVPRAGDVYSYGWIEHPVRLVEGRNDFLFRVSRGRVRAELVKPARSVAFTKKDMILPHLLIGEEEPLWGAVRVINARAETLSSLKIRCEVDGALRLSTAVGVIGPMTTRKVGFRIPAATPRKASSDEKTDDAKAKATIVLIDAATGSQLDSLEVDLSRLSPSGNHNRTFISAIDGSVQYYSVTPGTIEDESAAKPALFLSLHGASVKAEGQARSYKAKEWGHVVAPTNRRPYGFDWEDWGRLDAMEVLALAEERFDTDRTRTYLTGHSMGGHGVWHLGATFPARFGAIGPSAGWYSFWSYGGKKKDGHGSKIEELFARASNPSDTLALSRNFLHHGVYILHGDKDDNVPVEQARFMREHLAKFHADFAYYERPGAGHWWGGPCVDWPPLFDFLDNHTIPDKKQAKSVEFRTFNPGISSRSHYVSIEAQEKALDLSRAKITQDVKKRSFTGETENVAILALDLDQLDQGEELSVELDGIKVEELEIPAGADRIWLANGNDGWRQIERPDLTNKGPHRYGTFKDAFRNRMVFVYSTLGTQEENEWSYAKARFDAETFWYRGNGSIDVVADSAFDLEAEPDRNVIVYGNADTNALWPALLPTSPVQVGRNALHVGTKVFEGDDFGCYFVRPRPGSPTATVGVVSGTGLRGMKTANMNMYFTSGSGFADLLVFSADMLVGHFDGVKCVAYFGIDWSLETGEMAWLD